MQITKSWVLSLGLVAGVASAGETVRYSNPAYNGPYEYQRSYVEVVESADGSIQITASIPCGTKLNPMVLVSEPGAEGETVGAGPLRVVDDGASQCYVGTAPRFFRIGDRLEIVTGPRIRTPGFDGIYRFTREQ